jgi:hypothetical protein
MPAPHPRSTGSRTRAQLGFLALLLVPLLLFLHVPLLAAVIPGALITVASLESLHVRQQAALPSAEIVGFDDLVERQRIAVAAMIPAKHRRIDAEV